jgi:hypothetical protein
VWIRDVLAIPREKVIDLMDGGNSDMDCVVGRFHGDDFSVHQLPGNRQYLWGERRLVLSFEFGDRLRSPRCVVKVNQLTGPQRDHGVCAAIIVTELNLENSVGELLDQRSHLAGNQSLIREVFQQRYNVEGL